MKSFDTEEAKHEIKVPELEIEVPLSRPQSASNYAYDDDSENIYGMLCGDDLSTPVPTSTSQGYRNDSVEVPQAPVKHFATFIRADF